MVATVDQIRGCCYLVLLLLQVQVQAQVHSTVAQNPSPFSSPEVLNTQLPSVATRGNLTRTRWHNSALSISNDTRRCHLDIQPTNFIACTSPSDSNHRSRMTGSRQLSALHEPTPHASVYTTRRLTRARGFGRALKPTKAKHIQRTRPFFFGYDYSY